MREATLLLDDTEARARMTRVGNPYGDGHAAERIAAAIRGWAATQPPAK